VQLERHAHLVAFEKSDLLFVCMLKPLSSEITIDEKEIQAAKVLITSIVNLPIHFFFFLVPYYRQTSILSI
jgi:hypothetical protein